MIKENIRSLRERIADACVKVKRDPAAVTVVAISKGRMPELIKEVFDADITDIGENRVQEALLKYNALTIHGPRPTTIKWHMVGHLQTNKAKDAVKIFDLIQSVDSLRLAVEIDKEAAKLDKVQEILLEVKTSSEATKFGIRPEEAEGVIREIIQYKNIRLRGLMTIAPIVSHPEDARPYFRKLRESLEALNSRPTIHDPLRVLSMGMTDDFQVAIEEGATMVRLGRAIFD